MCAHCGKKPQTGNLVSYSQRKTLRRFNPNLFWKRIWDAATKSFNRTRICSRCLKAKSKKV
ncbi:MAG: 50S ribosomal protein L28 [Candidatus Gracilibacteria bacterium]